MVRMMGFHSSILVRVAELIDCWVLLNGTLMAQYLPYLHDYSMPIDSKISVKGKTLSLNASTNKTVKK